MTGATRTAEVVARANQHRHGHRRIPAVLERRVEPDVATGRVQSATQRGRLRLTDGSPRRLLLTRQKQQKIQKNQSVETIRGRHDG